MSKKERVTLKDLAKELNLSASTISRAISDHPAISESTKKKVKQKASELGFIPNSIAASFRKKRTQSLAIVVPRIDIYFHSLVISGVEKLAYNNHYNVTIFQSNDSLEREKEIMKTLQNGMVDGIIICLSNQTKTYGHFAKFEKLGVPLIFYDRVPQIFNANKIVVNDFESAFNATEHLIRQGCKKIGHIAGNLSTHIFEARYKGYIKALEKHGLEYDDNLVMKTSHLSYDEGVRAAEYLSKLKKPPDGLFCANDYTAISSVQVFLKAGIKIPYEIAIVGFSNYPISNIIEPKLTTVNDKAFLMGEAAAKLIIRQIEDDDTIIGYETITLETELIVRESSNRTKL